MKLHDVPFGSLGGVDEQRIARKCPEEEEEEEEEEEKKKDSNKSTIIIKIPKHLESLTRTLTVASNCIKIPILSRTTSKIIRKRKCQRSNNQTLTNI